MGIKELRQKRLEKLKEFNKLGLNPYKVKFDIKDSIQDIVKRFKEKQTVSCAGRLIGVREHGKVIFADIKSNGNKIQIYLSEKELQEQFALFKKLDVGDILAVMGKTVKTRTGEYTIQVETFKLLSKAIRPIPEKWHGLKDVEERYRKRYLDLISSNEVQKFFQTRAHIIAKIREFLDSRGYLEVETPMLHQIPGGAAGSPFKTHLNVYDMDLYLRIAPELYLKRLLVGGYEKVYEINRSFRNEGISTRHNPEFTMLEIYKAYADFNDMIKLTQDLITYVCENIGKDKKIEFNGEKINLSTPWKQLSFVEALGFDPKNVTSEEVMKAIRKKVGIKGREISRSQILNISEDLVEERLSNVPIFVIDYLKDMCPLAKVKPDNPDLSERFELFIGGMEIANAYSELNDPEEQEIRFKEQLKYEGNKKSSIDEDYIEALEYGMPPAGGLGVGIDRLVMLFTNNSTIRDVILFPQLKPR